MRDKKKPITYPACFCLSGLNKSGLVGQKFIWTVELFAFVYFLLKHIIGIQPVIAGT